MVKPRIIPIIVKFCQFCVSIDWTQANNTHFLLKNVPE